MQAYLGICFYRLQFT